MMETRKQVIELNIEDVLPNRFQPRIKFNEEAINELAKSIKEHGVIQPIVVRPIGDKFEIIAGERRYKASKMVGKTTIPAIITDLNDKDSAEVALIENVQRENLTPIEEAISYKKILDMGYITQDALAGKLGKTQSTVANKLRLLNLDDEVQEALLNEKISERHARSLLKLTNKDQQKELLKKIINERLTVRRADEEIEKMLSGTQINNNENKESTTNLSSESNKNPFEEFNYSNIEDNNKPEKFKFINSISTNIEEEKIEDEFIKEEPKDESKEEIQEKKFFNILEEDKKERPEQDEQLVDKMFINPSNSTENSLLEEIKEIENSINNSNNLPPLDTPQQPEQAKEELKIEEPIQNELKEEKNSEKLDYDDFDDEFIEEESVDEITPSETQNETINNIGISSKHIGNFKDVLEEIRDCSRTIENSGYQLETEEIDLDNEYQVIFKIKKDN